MSNYVEEKDLIPDGFYTVEELKTFTNLQHWNSLRGYAGIGSFNKKNPKDEYEAVVILAIYVFDVEFSDSEYTQIERKFYTDEKMYEIMEEAKREGWNPYYGWDFTKHPQYLKDETWYEKYSDTLDWPVISE